MIPARYTSNDTRRPNEYKISRRDMKKENLLFNKIFLITFEKVIIPRNGVRYVVIPSADGISYE